jgi:hypothetical protein
VSVKYFIFLLTTVVASFSQNQVSIAGTVQDGRTQAPAVGVSVKVIGLNLTTITDTEGKFTFSGTSLLQMSESRKGAAPVADPKSLLYRHDAAGPAKVAICDLSGRQISMIYSGLLTAGFWRITPPELSPGVYLCTFDTPSGVHAVRFLTQTPSSGAGRGSIRQLPQRDGESHTGAAAKIKAASRPVDSLLLMKNGYRPAYVALNTYQETGLTISLEDTSTIGSDNATIIPDPSWTCFMPDGIAPPQLGEAVFRITLEYSAIHDVGITKFGRRRQFDIKGGTIKGDKIDGSFLSGGLDYELTLSNGSMELEQIAIFKAGNTPVLMRNAGVAPAGAAAVRVVLDFEAPNSSSFTWLNSGKFAAARIVDSAAKTIKLDVYDISKATLPEARIQIKDPADVPNQTWDCLKWTGSQGAIVFTESVSLGDYVTIGASKRGSRNIIPITGGTTSGRVKGKILAGGADYQLSGLDARYTLAPDDGEFIIVRNCGSGALIPVFEARVDGPYNFLNENNYLSSQPGMSGGGVSITFYERK